jgi:hypothetical protein
VNTLSDDPNPGPGLLTLRQAVADVNATPGPDTITFAPSILVPGQVNRIALLQGELELDQPVGLISIQGPGSGSLTINGKHLGRVLHIGEEASVNMSGVTIAGGLVTQGGGPGVDGRKFYGGGILNKGSLSLTDVVVTRNQVQGPNDGFVFPDGAGIYSDGPLTMTYCTVSDNVASGGIPYGGGIYCSGTLTIAQSHVTGNESTALAGPSGDGAAYGGGIFCDGSVDCSYSDISGNTASGGSYYPGTGAGAVGGGLFITGDNSAGGFQSSFVGCTIDSNSAVNSPSPGSTQAFGGGLAIDQSNTLFTQCQISNNVASATTSIGGGIESTEMTEIQISDSTVTGNSALGGAQVDFQGPGGSASGGGLATFGYTIIERSTISENVAVAGNSTAGLKVLYGQPNLGPVAGPGAYGGGIVGGYLHITDSTIDANHVTGGRGSDFNPLTHSYVGKGYDPATGTAGNGGVGEGAGIELAGGTLMLADSTVTGNTASGGAGGAGGTSYDNVIFQGGTSGSALGAGLSQTGVSTVQSGPPVLVNSIMSGNTAAGASQDITGTIDPTSAYNLIGIGGGLTNGVNGNRVGVTDPKLGALANNGGPTLTMLPLAGSPAIDHGSNAKIPAGVTTDQRGLARISNGTVDIGAVEVQQPTGSISGNVFNDANVNGIKDSTEKGLANFRVYLDLNFDLKYEPGEPTVLSDSSGNYQFKNLAGGTTYLVAEAFPAGWRVDSPSPAPVVHVPLKAGQSVTGINFANTQLALISGTVFNDTNGNGQRDAGESGLSGWRVYLDLNNDGKFESNETSVLTDAAGNWSFTRVPPGVYVVRIVAPAGWKTTAPAGGSFTIGVGSGSVRWDNRFGVKHA